MSGAVPLWLFSITVDRTVRDILTSISGSGLELEKIRWEWKVKMEIMLNNYPLHCSKPLLWPTLVIALSHSCGTLTYM